MSLTAPERETLILWSDADSTATLTTLSPREARRFKKAFPGISPEISGPTHRWTVPLDRLRVFLRKTPVKRPVSEAQRAALARGRAK